MCFIVFYILQKLLKTCIMYIMNWYMLFRFYSHAQELLDKTKKPIAFLAHLSQRLIGELIVYQWSGVRSPSVRLSVVRPSSTMLKDLLLRNRWAIKAKFYVEPPWAGGTIFCSRHLGHMTKMAATPIYGKNPSKIFFSRTEGPIFTKLGM